MHLTIHLLLLWEIGFYEVKTVVCLLLSPWLYLVYILCSIYNAVFPDQRTNLTFRGPPTIFKLVVFDVPPLLFLVVPMVPDENHGLHGCMHGAITSDYI